MLLNSPYCSITVVQIVPFERLNSQPECPARHQVNLQTYINVQQQVQWNEWGALDKYSLDLKPLQSD